MSAALRMVLEVAMLAAALGFGALAIRHWRAQGKPVLRGLGLGWDRRAGRDLLAGIAIATLAMLGIAAIEAALGAITVSPRQQSAGELGSWLLGKAAACSRCMISGPPGSAAAPTGRRPAWPGSSSAS